MALLHDRRRLPALAAVIAILAVGVLAYRGVVSFDTSLEERAVANASALLHLEGRVGLDVESDVQRSWLGRGTSGAVLTGAYALLYWPFVVGTAVFTLWRHRSSFRLLRNAMAVTGAVGLAVILAFPVAPPRLLPGFEDHVADAAVLGSLAHPSGLFNPYAAMPSFHVGWVLVAALALRRATGGWWPLLAPLTMSVAVVTTGNHYVLDVVAGAALAGLGWSLASPMQRAFEDAGWGRPTRQAATPVGARHRGEGPVTGGEEVASRRPAPAPIAVAHDDLVATGSTPDTSPRDRTRRQPSATATGRGGDMEAAAMPTSNGPAANAHRIGP